MKYSTQYCSKCFGLDDESIDCEHCGGTGNEPEEVKIKMIPFILEVPYLQSKALIFLMDREQKYKYGASYREVANALGVSVGTAQDTIRALYKKRLVGVTIEVDRSIVLTEIAKRLERTI